MYKYQAQADTINSSFDNIITELQDLKESFKTSVSSIADNPDVFAQYVIKNNEAVATEYDKVIEKIKSAQGVLKTRAKDMDDVLEEQIRKKQEEAQKTSTESNNLGGTSARVDCVALNGDGMNA